MAGSDPRTNRAVGQRPDRADIDHDEDPLIELARIVSEDGGFGARPDKPRVVRDDPQAHDSLADGLEAELIQELETSFSRREVERNPAPAREPPPAPRVERAAGPLRAPPPLKQAPPPPLDDDPDPDELLRSIEEQLSQFERRQADRFPAGLGGFATEPPDQPEPPPPPAAANPAFGAPQSRGQAEREVPGRRASRIRPFAEDLDAFDAEPAADADPYADEPAGEPLPLPRSEYRFRGQASADWDRMREEPAHEPADRPEADYRNMDAAVASQGDVEDDQDAAPAASQADDGDEREARRAARRRETEARREANRARRRERRAEAFPEFEEAEERPAELAQPDFSGIAASLSRELQSGYPDDAEDKWQDGDAPADDPQVSAAAAPPSARRTAPPVERGRGGAGRIALVTALGVVLVVLIGAGAAYYLRTGEEGSSGAPPVITADAGAVRVEAEPEQPVEGETVGEAVYNRVAGAAPSTDEQVVDSAEEPREIARIVLPQSQGESEEALVRPVGEEGTSAGAETPAAEAPQSATPAPAPEQEVGPRQVPTFVVRADGTIVTTTESGSATPDPTPGQSQQLATETEPIEPTPVPTVAIGEASPAGETTAAPESPAPVAEAPLAPTPGTMATEDDAVEDIVPRSTIVESDAAGPVEAPAEPAAVEEEFAAVDAAPVDAAEAQPPTPAVSEAAGGFLVQLSAQRSMEQAQGAYAASQQRFPSVLGSLDPQIEEADLGEKGVYFRVRVGPWPTRDEAVGVCESLKAAGGTCFVTQ